MAKAQLISIGELARRTGMAVSAIRFYEEKGLVSALRTSGNQRRFLRADIRRISFILIAQQCGLSLDEIAAQLASLPNERNPSLADWQKISRYMRARIEAQIAMLERSRDRLDGCLGCGCLSLAKCQLYNPDDRMGQRGTGPRAVLD